MSESAEAQIAVLQVQVLALQAQTAKQDLLLKEMDAKLDQLHLAIAGWQGKVIGISSAVSVLFAAGISLWNAMK
jgi:hypothetical protein